MSNEQFESTLAELLGDGSDAGEVCVGVWRVGGLESPLSS